MDNLKFIKATTPKAAKEHICSACGKPISKGESYSNLLYKDEKGKLVRFYLHSGCSLHKKGEVKKVGPQFHKLPKTEEELKQIVKADTIDMLQTFSMKENLTMVYRPLIITEMAWVYADKVLEYAAKNKISQTAKLSRATKALKKAYYEEIGKDLNKKWIDGLRNQSLHFMNQIQNDLFILWLQIGQVMSNQCEELPFKEMRQDAYIAAVIIRLIDLNEKKVEKILREKTGDYTRIVNPKVDALKDCMEAFVSPYEIELGGHIETSMKILDNKLSEIEFNVV